jgi:hypothetical protein
MFSSITARTVSAVGNILIFFSALTLVGHELLKSDVPSDINMIMLVGDGCLAAIGAITVLMGRAIGNLEVRIRELEHRSS